MSDEVFSRLRPHFQIPDDVPIRKGDLGEKCYDGRSSDVAFYETAFIAGKGVRNSVDSVFSQIYYRTNRDRFFHN